MAEPRRFDRKSFQEWASHPLTRLYRQLLEDQRHQLMADWGRGVLMSPEAQFKARHLLELSTLSWAETAEFYGLEPDETGSGAQ